MDSLDRLKKELMVFAIDNDFFGYGSRCYKRSDGRYVSIVDGEREIYSGRELAAEWDMVDLDDKKDIIRYFSERELGVPLDS